MNTKMIALYRRLTSGEDYPALLVPLVAVVRWSMVFYWQLVRDRAFSLAGSMAYVTLIAFVPLLLLMFGVLGALGLLDQSMVAIEGLVFQTFLADIPEIRDLLLPGLMRVDLGALGLVGVAGLVVITARLYLMVERAYCDIFGVPVDRPLPNRLLNFYFTLTAVPGVVVGAAIGASRVASGLGAALPNTLLAYLLPYLVIFAALKLFPSTRVRWRAAAVGALVSWALLQLGGRLFPLYIKFFASDDPLHLIYGSLGLIPVFLIWLYLLWIFVLLGVEVAYVAQNFKSLLQAEVEQLERERRILRAPSIETALEVAVWVAWYFEQGMGAAPLEELTARCGMRTRETAQILRVLERLDLVAKTDQGWLITRPPDDIELVEVATGWRRITSVRRSETDPVGDDIGKALGQALEGNLANAISWWVPNEVPELALAK